MRVAIDGAVFRDGKILLVDKKGTWILPGGKPEEGEGELEGLAREFGEELSGTEIDVNGAMYVNNFVGISPNSRRSINVKVYKVDVIGDVGEPSREISGKRWFSYEEAQAEGLSDLTWNIVDSLHRDGYFEG